MSIRIVDVAGGTVVPSTLINCYGALSLPAYWRAINFLAENLASFPRSIRQDGTKADEPHRLEKLIRRRPNGLQNAFVFWRTLFAAAAHNGNGYAKIERDPITGDPVALHNLDACDVCPFRFTPDGETAPGQFYLVRSAKTVLPAADVIHLQLLSYDGQTGIDPVSLHESTFQRAATLDRYTTKYLTKGTMIRGAIEIPQGVDEEKVAEIQATLRMHYQGAGADRDTIVLSDGAKLNNATLSPQESQLIEQGAYTTKQVAQIVGVPPEMLYEMSDAKYVNNVEAAGQNVVRYTFRPWITQIEAELTAKLLTESDQNAGYSVHLNPDALLRGSTAEVNASAVTTKQAGIRTGNEARELIGLPPLNDPEANKLKTAGDTAPQQAKAA